MCKKLFFAFTFCFVAMVNIEASAQKNNATSVSKKQAPKMDIHTAVVTGNIEAVKQHIAAGTDLNQKDPMGGSSPLMTACLFEQKAIANLLISAGADLNVKNNDGSTALHVAAFFGKTEMVKILLAKKANKSLKNNYGNTAYETVAGPFSAVKSIYEQMQQILAPMGVKLDLKYIEKIRPAIATMLK